LDSFMMAPNEHFVPHTDCVGQRMNRFPIDPSTDAQTRPTCCLSFFDSQYAATIVTWIADSRELLWLAPGTPPPLTIEKVTAWGQERRGRYLFWSQSSARPAGYAELNEMPDCRQQLWIGHFLLNPACRGRALGLRFAQALLARAFLECDATDVSLVVFPDNTRAVRCYQRAGMVATDRERKYFPATGRECLFLRMGMDRRRFIRLAQTGEMPSRPLPLLRFDALRPAAGPLG